MSPRVKAIVAAALLVPVAACTGGSTVASTSSTTAATRGDAPVLVYSGRNEKLVEPLLDRLATQLGVAIEVRYGDSSELAAQLLEEGERTQADLFFSQDAGALGALAGAGRLQPLGTEITGLVGAGFSDAQGRWVATSARARVVVYDPRLAPEAATMTGIDGILDPRYRGQLAYAPTNASFHSFVTALRVARGETGARDWLTRFKANEPKAFANNNAVLDAVDAGQAALGLINHYYWHMKVASRGAAAVSSRIRFLGSDDPGALVNAAGVGVIHGSPQRRQAEAIVAALLAPDSQLYFADETAEYPVVAGVTSSKHSLPALGDRAQIDLNRLDSLKATLALLDEVGLT